MTFIPPTDCKESKLLMIDRVPVIGTLLDVPTVIKDANVMSLVPFFFSGYGVDPDGALAAWKKSMWRRVFKWQPRYGTDGVDRNVDRQYEERITDQGKTMCWYPKGYSIPPDGWLISPRFEHGLLQGQTAYFACGKEWLNSNDNSDYRPAKLGLTGRTEFIPLHNYV
jgi:hypothetical protein